MQSPGKMDNMFNVCPVSSWCVDWEDELRERCCSHSLHLNPGPVEKENNPVRGDSKAVQRRESTSLEVHNAGAITFWLRKLVFQVV